MEPVLAGAPSVSYRFGKLVRRNRSALCVGAALVFLAVALLVSVSLLLQEFHAAKQAGLLVQSNPEGAEVWHDGRKIGLTPFRAANLPLGELAYSLVLSNHETITNTAIVASKKQVSHFIFLRQGESRGVGILPNLRTNITEITARSPHDGTILDIQGTVEVARSGKSEWILAQTNMLISVGDRLRTSSKSQATLRFPDRNILRLSELSLMAIQPPTPNRQKKSWLDFLNGALTFFKQDGNSNSFDIQTRSATVKVSG